MGKNKKPGHIDTHRQTNPKSPPKSICVYVTRQSQEREPINESDISDSPYMFLFGTMPFYQPAVLLSSHQKHVDGFERQRNCSPSISLPGKQCIAVHIYYLASNAYLYDLVLGEQCSDPDRNHFCHIWLVGIFPNPYDRTSASCAIFSKRFKQVFWISWLSLKSIYTC